MSGLVFGRPRTFWPSLNWPRFFKSSTRSKRFKTFRFAVIVLAPLRLRCCDIKRFFLREFESREVTTVGCFFNRSSQSSKRQDPSSKEAPNPKLQVAQFLFGA